MRFICFPIIYIYEKFQFELIFMLLYLLISAVDIITIVFSSQYFINCELSSGQKGGLICILIFISYILIRRILIFFGQIKTYTNSDFDFIKLSKCVLYLVPALISYIGNIKFYKNLDLEYCSNVTANIDNLVFILIFGIISSLNEIDNLYNIWNTLVVRERSYENRSRVSPIPSENIEIVTISNEESLQKKKENIINKINNLDFINNIESDCNICLDNTINIISLECNHVFHKECIIKWIKQDIHTSLNCPSCRNDIK